MSKIDAQSWVAVVESEIVRGVFQDRRAAAQLSLDDLLVRYAHEVTPAKNGASAERYQIEALRRDALSAALLPDVTSARLAQWRDLRLQVVSGSTVNRNLNLISHVFNVARREWGIAIENPVPCAFRRSRPLIPIDAGRVFRGMSAA
ncbi:MAG: hypothetical protein ACT4PG_06315 [Panacagrimonas sp.]